MFSNSNKANRRGTLSHDFAHSAAAQRKGLGRAAACAMFAFSVAIGGFNGIFSSGISLASHEIVFLRAILVASILGLALAAKRHRLSVLEHKKQGALVLAAGVGMACQWLFLYEAYQLAGVGTSTILLYCAPVLVMATSPLLFREALTPGKVAGFCVVIFGVLLVNATALQGTSSPLGILLGLIAALGFGATIVLNKKVDNVSGLEKAVVEMFVVAIIAGLYTFCVKGSTLNLASGDVAPLALLVLNSAVGFSLYFKSMNELSVQSVAVLGYLEPLCAVVMGVAFLGEAMGAAQAIGAALIIGGATASELRLPLPLPRFGLLSRLPQHFGKQRYARSGHKA